MTEKKMASGFTGNQEPPTDKCWGNYCKPFQQGKIKNWKRFSSMCHMCKKKEKLIMVSIGGVSNMHPLMFKSSKIQ
ncbi:hypothetical protein SLEP1_g50015 [Rubroshorea leprosula]|uniref:Uncharacterized protein n=1 Tax=Rubroshorea leprosula TaxID=152421 RepID=A0AAV5LZK0_9ROSI|nr:hypothetical protein SLEP1_g50015 [Rubroshorea leprosula]